MGQLRVRMEQELKPKSFSPVTSLPWPLSCFGFSGALGDTGRLA
jgi:hypothetical protein